MAREDQPQPALGRAIKELREEQGKTQEALAYEAGLTTGTLSLVERGLSNPSWGTVKAIAEALGTSMAELATLSASVEGRE